MSKQIYKERRKRLHDIVSHKMNDNEWCIVLFADFEPDRYRFRQESSFFYFTGIEEPGAALVISSDGTSLLFAPRYMIDRSVWVSEDVPLHNDNAAHFGVDEIVDLGSPSYGYQLDPYSDVRAYSSLCAYVTSSGSTIICGLAPDSSSEYSTQRFLYGRIFDEKKIHNISDVVAALRRKKDAHELQCLQQAIDVTFYAQCAAGKTIKPGATEAEVCAALEAEMIKRQTRPAFPSIVATGYNATVLHYTQTQSTIKDGDLVVIDIGAESGYYAADITRTYPALGTFTERQKELYQYVLDAQAHVAQYARPGYWLKNHEKPEQSLHHIAVSFFKQKGYADYFLHGIGHYLGLDVHDVGSYQEPLQPGDVITIEPGLYLRNECNGIRIEDNYLITENNALCLSQNIPKSIEDIESLCSQE